jgi:hypothetical protein
MRTINVPLPDRAIERLRDLAATELRDARRQAAALILEGLERADRARQARQRRA